MSVNLFDRAGVDKRLFLILLAGSIFGSIAILPYVSSLDLFRKEQLPIPLSVLMLVQVVQSAIIFSIAIFVGLFLGKKIGFGAPLMESWLRGESVTAWLKTILTISLGFGVLIGVSIFVLDRFVFTVFVESVTAHQTQAPLWQRFLVSFYGGINEEIFMRLFLMTLIVWLACKIRKTKEGMLKSASVWFAIIIVSVLFGLGHLPMTARFMEITPVVVIRGIMLNGVAGIAFGWLYWKRGLESAIISHFSADIVLHVILPLLY